MSNYIINIFLPTAVETFSICCIWGMMCENYRDSKLKIVAIVLSIASITTVLDIFAIDINVGINALLLTVILILFYKVSISTAFFDSISVMALYMTMEMLLLLIIGTLNEVQLKNDNLISIGIAILAAIIFILTRIRKIYIFSQRNYEKYKNELRWIFLNLFGIYMIYLFEWNSSYFQFGNLKPLFIISFIFIVVTNFVLMLIVIKSKKQNHEATKLKELEELRESFLTEMAEKQHEFANHLQTIAGMCQEDTANIQIREYIEEILQKRRTDSKLLYTGDGAISGFLSAKKREAEDKGIVFSAQVTKPMPAFPCAGYELIEMMGNLLNNAFDAVEALSVKEVFLEIGTAEGHAFLQVMNGIPDDFDLNVNQMMQQGFSTKQGEVRGFGLSNIKRLAEEYNGKLAIYINERVIQIKISF